MTINVAILHLFLNSLDIPYCFKDKIQVPVVWGTCSATSIPPFYFGFCSTTLPVLMEGGSVFSQYCALKFSARTINWNFLSSSLPFYPYLSFSSFCLFFIPHPLTRCLQTLGKHRSRSFRRLHHCALPRTSYSWLHTPCSLFTSASSF